MTKRLNPKRSKGNIRSFKKDQKRSRLSCSSSTSYYGASPHAHSTRVKQKFMPLHISLLVVAALPLATEALILKTERHALGDNQRSETSSSSFFQSIDRDGDGTVARSELSEFLETSIGGTEFDEASEIKSEIDSVMKKLDLRSDGLEEKDFFNYWNKLEKLLTVEEVAEWVEHAVQLPDVAK